jgi:Holliday junction resolvase RusA-like endonuclease
VSSQHGLLFEADIPGELASKANSRMVARRKGKKPWVIKSPKARAWLRGAVLILGARRPPEPLEGELILHARIWYQTERPDLDVSLLCDALQLAGIIGNDRQIREQHLTHSIDRANPRISLKLSSRSQSCPPD